MSGTRTLAALHAATQSSAAASPARAPPSRSRSWDQKRNGRSATSGLRASATPYPHPAAAPPLPPPTQPETKSQFTRRVFCAVSWHVLTLSARPARVSGRGRRSRERQGGSSTGIRVWRALCNSLLNWRWCPLAISHHAQHAHPQPGRGPTNTAGAANLGEAGQQGAVPARLQGFLPQLGRLPLSSPTVAATPFSSPFASAAATPTPSRQLRGGGLRQTSGVCTTLLCHPRQSPFPRNSRTPPTANHGGPSAFPLPLETCQFFPVAAAFPYAHAASGVSG